MAKFDITVLEELPESMGHRESTRLLVDIVATAQALERKPTRKALKRYIAALRNATAFLAVTGVFPCES